ncbi:hypothetical protein KO465_03620 [Candidatus Micrarchaeota archaeon]|nr:hypothetical protein [Candidatus Micrarchaeota archaeon]
MKVTICGSIAFYEDMLKIKKQLEHLGHDVDLPPIEVEDENGNMIPVSEYYKLRKNSDETVAWVWERKKQAILWHFKKIEWADAVLILNYDKKGVENYIGGNTFLEIGLAFYLHKKIFLYNPIPEISYKEELLGMDPVILNKDLTKIG